MTIADISQFNPENKLDYLYGDPEIFQAMEMAVGGGLISELAARQLEITTDAASMAELRHRLQIPAEIGIGISAIRATDATQVMPDGASFMEISPESLGYCFSAGIEQDGRDMLELFVAIDPSRYPESDADGEPTDEQVDAIVELNHYVITQLLIGLDGDDSDEEPSDEAYAAIEEKASIVLETMLDEGISPILAIIPGNDDEDEE